MSDNTTNQAAAQSASRTAITAHADDISADDLRAATRMLAEDAQAGNTDDEDDPTADGIASEDVDDDINDGEVDANESGDLDEDPDAEDELLDETDELGDLEDLDDFDELDEDDEDDEAEQRAPAPPDALDSEERVRLMAQAADAVRAEDIEVLDLRQLTIIADYFLICTGKSSIQLRAIADRIEERMRDAGIRKPRMEGYQEATWILLDYGDVVAHLMAADQRDFYRLEEFWAAAPRLPLELLPEESRAPSAPRRFDPIPQAGTRIRAGSNEDGEDDATADAPARRSSSTEDVDDDLT